MKARDVLAADVLAKEWTELEVDVVWDEVAGPQTALDIAADHCADSAIDILLAQTPEGEGVYIAPDGTLMRADADNCRCGACDTLYRLVPIEEATDE